MEMYKKSPFIFLIVFTWVSIFSCRIIATNSEFANPTTPAVNINTALPVNYFLILAQNDSIPPGWKIYSNTKYGFSFRYPPAFSQAGKEQEVSNLSGKLTMVEINFVDYLSDSRLVIQYHLAPAGQQLYQYAVSALHSSRGQPLTVSRELEVCGGKGIETVSKISLNGKDNRVSPYKLVVVDFLDRQKTGEMELQFNTPVPGELKQVKEFHRLLSTFKFTDKLSPGMSDLQSP